MIPDIYFNSDIQIHLNQYKINWRVQCRALFSVCPLNMIIVLVFSCMALVKFCNLDSFRRQALFLKKCLMNVCILFLTKRFLGKVPIYCKLWIWFKRPEGHFWRLEKSNLANFSLGGNLLKYSHYFSFPRRYWQTVNNGLIAWLWR